MNKGVHKEENILLAAEKLFGEKGFHGASTREIAKEACVNVSMISYYFGSKEQLAEKIFENRLVKSFEFADTIAQDESLDEWQRFITIINRYVDEIREHSSFYRVFQSKQFINENPRIQQILESYLLSFLKIYQSLVDSGYGKGIFTKKSLITNLHATISGTIFFSMNGIGLYSKFLQTPDTPEFRDQITDNIKQHLKTILKDLLGYEEK